MSGHSHFATIKRQKELKDKSKGKIFSKLGRSISMAVKEGGGPDPDSNFKLRIAIETARSANMPKDNIARAIANASKEGDLEEVVYEGFGPTGVGFIVVAATDNRNRTGQGIKNIFEKAGGSLGGPGSVSFNFKSQGELLVDKKDNNDDLMLKIIDMGVEDIVENTESVAVFTEPSKLFETKKQLEEGGFTVKSARLAMRPINLVPVGEGTQEKIESLINAFEENDDVQEVFTNYLPQSNAVN